MITQNKKCVLSLTFLIATKSCSGENIIVKNTKCFLSFLFFLLSRILYASCIYRTKTSCQDALSKRLLMWTHFYTSCSIKFLFNAPITLCCYFAILLRDRIASVFSPFVYTFIHTNQLFISFILPSFRNILPGWSPRVDRDKFTFVSLRTWRGE